MQKLVGGAPCELCVGAGGQHTLRWGRPLTVRTLPHWHSWQGGGHVVEVDRASGTVRVQLPDGPAQQVSSRDKQGGVGGGHSNTVPTVVWRTAGCQQVVCSKAGKGACMWEHLSLSAFSAWGHGLQAPLLHAHAATAGAPGQRQTCCPRRRRLTPACQHQPAVTTAAATAGRCSAAVPCDAAGLARHCARPEVSITGAAPWQPAGVLQGRGVGACGGAQLQPGLQQAARCLAGLAAGGLCSRDGSCCCCC